MLYAVAVITNTKAKSNGGRKGFFVCFLSLACICVLLRTSDSLNEGLPIKMTREKFQRK